MVTAGKSCPTKYCPEEVGLATLTALGRTVPAAVPGIGFLSGGQTEEEATLNLNAINTVQAGDKPWHTTFCFGRALQTTMFSVWGGQDENVPKAQHQLLIRAKVSNHLYSFSFVKFSRHCP